jgi:hypothetical protein
MRTTLALAATLSLSSAQLINIPAVLDTPTPALSIDPLAPPPAITYDATAASSSIAAAADAGTPPAITRRALAPRNETCSPRPLGAGPVPSPDTSSAFLASADLAAWAKNASTPANYTASFTNLHASTTAPKYVGFVELPRYDVANCSALCDARAGCTAINVFFERAPTVVVAQECPDPKSSTLIKCVFWGEAVTAKNTINSGYTEQGFVVAIAASNGYNKGDAVKEAKKSGVGRAGVNAGLALMGLAIGVAAWM